MRLCILASHPIQYHAPLFRALASRIEVTVLYAHRQTPEQQGAAGYGAGFEWDIDLTTGFNSRFLHNSAPYPGVDRFDGCSTPEIGAELERENCDALLVMGWNLKVFIQATLAARRRGIPVLVRGDSQLATARSGFRKAVKALTYPLLLRSFEAALYVGERSRAYYRHFGVPDGKLYFVPHCVDATWFASRATPEAGAALRTQRGIGLTEKVVAFAGRLVPFKRPEHLLEAVNLLRNRSRHIHVVVAGSGELEQSLVESAGRLGVRLHILGFQNQTEMPAVYAAADVLALPSDGGETWGLVANEALASGTPVLVSSAAGCSEDFGRDGVAARSYPFGDFRAMADALEEMLQSPPPREAVSALSNSYGIAVAVSGIVNAVAAVREREGRRQRDLGESHV